MKKQQKIIALRTEAKLKVAEIETKIAFARSEAAEKRSSIMWERAAELEGLEAGSTERYDVLAKYRAKLADVEEKLAVTVAQLKAEIQQKKSECEKMCAAAEDDPEPETDTDTDTDTDVTVKGFQPQETVYCDGSEHSARIVARRLINKLPHIPEGGSISVMISRGEGDLGDRYWFSACTTDGTHLTDGATSKMFDEYSHNANSEAEYINMVRDSFNARKEGCNE